MDAWERQTLNIAAKDAHVALRVLSAVVYSWDDLFFAQQGRIISDAFSMRDGHHYKKR